ncbi:4-fold beta flower protein [Aeromicrobium sp. UC242_57]|uniref:4-fold beta flower protein n=1 Tax=Aeromicrobium sp. UC242_57 TaxID=3374624 RepID=UPI0037B42B64
MSVYLFDMSGQPVAFRRTWTDTHIFDLDGHWVGWFPWDDNDAVDPNGAYLGTVVDDRLVRRNDWQARPCVMTPTSPGTVSPTGQPTTPHYFPNCFAYQDVRIHHHA